MQKAAIVILAGITLGLLSFIIVGFDGSQKSDVTDLVKSDTDITTALAGIQKRLSAFEEKMAEIVELNNELETIINDLGQDESIIAKIKTATELSKTEKVPGLKKVVVGGESKKETKPDIEEKIAKYTDAGLSEDDARWIVEKQEEWELDSLYSQWESRKRFLEQRSTRKSSTDEIKERLGPEGYERYLKSIGSDISIIIGNVTEGAPGDLAGLKPNDEIISYNGERVYNYIELQDASVRGELGEPVTIDLIRNGEKIQINMERGPLGFYQKRKGGVYYTSTLPSFVH